MPSIKVTAQKSYQIKYNNDIMILKYVEENTEKSGRIIIRGNKPGRAPFL